MKYFLKIFQKIERSSPLYLLTFLFFFGILIYGNILLNDFVWDDEEQIVNNPIVQNISNIPYLFTTSTFNTGGAGLSGWYYKPLMPVSFSLVHLVFGASPFGFHFLNLSMHIINSFLVFLLFKNLFNLVKLKTPQAISFMLSLLFLIHPVNVESVAYISSTQELLYVFFLLIALLFLFKNYSLKNLVVLNISVLFALFSKESGIIAIFAILAFVYIFNRSKMIIYAGSLSLTFIFYLILRFPIAKTPLFHKSAIIPIASASFSERLMTVPFEIFSYLRLLFFPKNLFVAQHFVIKNFNDPRFFISLLGSVFIIFFFLYFLRYKSRLYLFFFIWVLMSFSIILNVYALDMTIAERWMYGPIIPILGIIGLGFSKVAKSKFANLSFLLLMIIIVVFSARTFNRTFDWRNNLTLFETDIKHAKSFDAENNLGVAYFRVGKIKEAKKHFQNSIDLSPNWWTPYNNLGAIVQSEGKTKEAKKLYEQSIINGNYYLAYENLAKLKLQTESEEEVLKFSKKALEKLPNNEILNKVAAITSFKSDATDSAKVYAERAFTINRSQENYLLLQEINKNVKN